MRKILLFLTLCLPVLLIAQVDLEISVVYLDNGDVGQEINVILENKAIGYRAARTTNDLGKVTFTGLSTSGTYTAFVLATDVERPVNVTLPKSLVVRAARYPIALFSKMTLISWPTSP
ncbi:MAG: hypothetical protein AAFV78_17330, partial [Bacteroidota bacterium]